VTADFEAEPHFLVFGDTETGKTNLLRVLTGELAERREPKKAYFVVVDYRRGLLDAVPRDRLLAFAHTAATAQKAIGDVTEAMRQRLPSGDLTAEQLRAPDAAAGFAGGPELFVVVDDYDLVVTPSSNPMTPLLEVLALSRDIGLHVILARSTGGAGRAGYEPFLQRLEELGTPGVVLSGNPDEGPLLGDITPRRLPPGRGRYYRRRQGTQLVQTALW
jgi:S-DNA-T family DNA segregation ATPase FtsK/SpoIIIE